MEAQEETEGSGRVFVLSVLLGLLVPCVLLGGVATVVALALILAVSLLLGFIAS